MCNFLNQNFRDSLYCLIYLTGISEHEGFSKKFYSFFIFNPGVKQ